MKIFGDKSSSEFKNYEKEPGLIFGNNDVLKGSKTTVHHYKASFFGTSSYSTSIEPKLYLHISTNVWSTFTGKLREYFLPWRWKTAYLNQKDGSKPRQILVCTSVHDCELSYRLKKILGKSLFLTNLISNNQYEEIFGQEFLRLEGENSLGKTTIIHPLGKIVGIQAKLSDDLYCHIYRPRSLYSKVKYSLLKQFSSSWKEIAIQSGQITEKILINKSDEAVISRSGLKV